MCGNSVIFNLFCLGLKEIYAPLFSLLGKWAGCLEQIVFRRLVPCNGCDSRCVALSETSPLIITNNFCRAHWQRVGQHVASRRKLVPERGRHLHLPPSRPDPRRSDNSGVSPWILLAFPSPSWDFWVSPEGGQDVHESFPCAWRTSVREVDCLAKPRFS